VAALVESGLPHPSSLQSFARSGVAIAEQEAPAMQYMLLIHEDETFYAGEEGAARMHATLAAHMKLIEELAASGREWSGNRLKGAATATTIRYRDGEITLHDGPFAKTHEELGGYYIVDADDLDAAIEWARKIPVPGNGAIEVRPVFADPSAG
jgi:hypothetical protein